MPQNFNFYAIVGNNGYGLSPDWRDILSYAKLLESEWHRGFQTESDAYDWLVDQVGMRSRLNANGVCDLATLRSQQLVVIDNIRPVQESFHRKPVEVEVEEVGSLEELGKAIEEMGQKKETKKTSKKDRKKALVKHFEKWLDAYLDE